jgi:hypothetical protein
MDARDIHLARKIAADLYALYVLDWSYVAGDNIFPEILKALGELNTRSLDKAAIEYQDMMNRIAHRAMEK